MWHHNNQSSNHGRTFVKAELQKAAPKRGPCTGEITAGFLHLPHIHDRPRLRVNCVWVDLCVGTAWTSVSTEENEKVAYRPAIHQLQDRPGDSDYSRKGVVMFWGESSWLIYLSLSQVTVQDWPFLLAKNHSEHYKLWCLLVCVCVCVFSFFPPRFSLSLNNSGALLSAVEILDEILKCWNCTMEQRNCGTDMGRRMTRGRGVERSREAPDQQ